MADSDRTASLMTPAKLAQIKPKGAASPAAWLSQMAADAGHVHVRRLRELREQLRAQSGLMELSPFVVASARLAQALPALDFGLLRSRGWWARATGKSRTAGAEFAAQFQRIDEVARSVEAPAQGVRKQQQERAGAADLALLEIEVEHHAIEKIIDQGSRWLQDMRNQIKSREAAGPDAAAQEQLKEDAARCEILVTRLMVLRAVSSAVQQLLQQARGAASRRAALAQKLQQALASCMRAWHTRLAELAASAGDAASPALNLEDAMEAHRELQLCVKQFLADCAQLEAQEKLAAESLAALEAQLEAA
jgi:hypothetical protein